MSPANYPARIFMTFNPIPQIPGSMHWLQRRFLQVPHTLSTAVIDKKTNALFSEHGTKTMPFAPRRPGRCSKATKRRTPRNTSYGPWESSPSSKGACSRGGDIVSSVPEGVDCTGVGLDFGFSNDPSASVRVWCVRVRARYGLNN